MEMEGSKVWDVVLTRVAPMLLVIIGYFITSKLNSIDQRLSRVEKLLVDVPVAQEQIRGIQQKNKEQDEEIVYLTKLVADLPRNTYELRPKK
jgi:CHASE3 domain sensor protein